MGIVFDDISLCNQILWIIAPIPLPAAYGPLRAMLQRQGTPLGNLDTLIAAHAVATGSVPVSNDKALLCTPGMRVEEWSVG